MKYVVAILVFGMLLLAGCGGAPTQPQPSQPAPSPPPSPPPAAQQPPQSLAGMGFAQLVTLGMPVRCTVTTTQDGQRITMTLWLKGGNFRSEVKPPGSAEVLVTIVRGGDTFLRVTEELRRAFAAIGKKCDWLKITPQEVAEPPKDRSARPRPTSASELESIPPTNFQCNPDVFGDEKFATPGSICSYAELLGELVPPLPPESQPPPSEDLLQQCLSACALLPPAQQAQCQQQCAAAVD
ncbi:MAG: hypothetical protein QXG98_00395 [Candidatus Micrarchaeia archaeon]